MLITLPPPFTRFWPASCHSTSPPSGALTVWRLCGPKWTSIHLPPSSGEMAAMQRWLLASGGNTECWGGKTSAGTCCKRLSTTKAHWLTDVVCNPWSKDSHWKKWCFEPANKSEAISRILIQEGKLQPNRRPDGWDVKSHAVYCYSKCNSEW